MFVRAKLQLSKWKLDCPGVRARRESTETIVATFVAHQAGKEAMEAVEGAVDFLPQAATDRTRS